MGMDQKVVFPLENMPTWAPFVDFLARHNVPVHLRMIDGELAVPDETPPWDWRELRIGTASGIVTLLREADGIRLVIWGNADQKLRQEWNALAWAIGALTGGGIHIGAASFSSSEFADQADLPEGFR
jgi:hypothetical protein